MLYEEITYRKESEIDNAFPYLDKLNQELDELKKQKDALPSNYQKPKFNIKNIFKNKKQIISPIEIVEKKKLIKSSSYKKDGYYFRVRLYRIYNEKEISQTLYFEFYVNIKYVNVIKNKQFFKKFINEVEAKVYYEDMCGVFKNLKRRDLMEKLFKEKEEEIKYLKSWLINR